MRKQEKAEGEHMRKVYLVNQTAGRPQNIKDIIMLPKQ